MSSIIEKPFSWANKIIRAVFRGAPNLITSSDLNRQIEALKKEMYVLQQASSVIIANLTYYESKDNETSRTFYAMCSYVFCGGAKFDVSAQVSCSYNTDDVVSKELRLYAKKSLVTFSDDFSKDISGAKFEDGTTQPAADHYIYEEATLYFVDTDDVPDSDFNYANKDGKEYICTLLRLNHQLDAAKNPKTWVHRFTAPMGKGLADTTLAYGKLDAPVVSASPKTIVSPESTWQDAIHTLSSRLYTLEKRLFMDVKYGNSFQSLANLHTYESKRKEVITLTSDSASSPYKEITISYYFRLIGNICIVVGNAIFTVAEGSTLYDVALSYIPRPVIDTPVCITPYLATLENTNRISAELTNKSKALRVYNIKDTSSFGWTAVYFFKSDLWCADDCDTTGFYDVTTDKFQKI